jgi:PAS domain S-box-containing protein
MFKGTTLKQRMILGGIAAVFMPFLITGIVIYIQLSNSLLEMTKEKSVLIAKDISGLIDATLMQEIKLISSIAANPLVISASKKGEYQDARAELEAIYSRIGEKKYFAMNLLDREGTIRIDTAWSQQVGLNVSDRDYFVRAREGKPTVAGPFHPKGTATPGEVIIIIAVPIEERGEFLGVVSMPINTNFLADIIGQKKLGRTGYAHLLNSEGFVIVHPKKEYNLALRLLDQPDTEEIGALIKSKGSGTASYVFDGTPVIAGLSSLTLTDWTVVFSQSRDEIMLPVNRILFSILICGVIFLLITTAIIILFSGKISSPVQKVMEMLKQLTQHSPEVILQIGLDRKILFANPAFERISGLKSKDILGTEPDLNNTGNTPAKMIWDALEAGTPWSGRVSLKGNQDKTTLDVMLLPFRDDRGTIQGYLEIGRDITSELISEERARESQKLEAIGTLAGGIAHDFNNILGAIFGYAELSLMKMEKDSEIQTYVKEIMKASKRARDLVSQILTFSRKTEVVLRPLLPGSILKEALKLLRASVPATISIQSEMNSDALIMAEPTQIHQIVMNLITNAVHAIGEDAGTIEVDLRDFTVGEEFMRDHPGIRIGKHINLRVSDSGCGMDSRVMERIFEPFFTTKPPGKGTGLGLSVVHGIVRKLGGIVTVYSEVGRGATFNVIIPVAETDHLGPSRQDSSIKEGTARIAIVDDEAALTKAIQSILASLGYRVKAFTDSAEALQTIRSNPGDFDILLVDYTMPQITGLELVRSLRKAGINIPVILTSGYFNQEIEDAARNEGISELIAKPLNTYQLTDAIHRALHG